MPPILEGLIYFLIAVGIAVLLMRAGGVLER